MPKAEKGDKKQQEAQQAELRKHKQKLLRAALVFPTNIDVTAEIVARGAIVIREALNSIKAERERCKNIYEKTVQDPYQNLHQEIGYPNKLKPELLEDHKGKILDGCKTVNQGIEIAKSQFEAVARDQMQADAKID